MKMVFCPSTILSPELIGDTWSILCSGRISCSVFADVKEGVERSFAEDTLRGDGDFGADNIEIDDITGTETWSDDNKDDDDGFSCADDCGSGGRRLDGTGTPLLKLKSEMEWGGTNDSNIDLACFFVN